MIQEEQSAQCSLSDKGHNKKRATAILFYPGKRATALVVMNDPTCQS